MDHIKSGIDGFQGRIPDATLAFMKHIRHHQPNVKISVELEKPSREGLLNLAVLADVVFYCKNWAQVRDM